MPQTYNYFITYCLAPRPSDSLASLISAALSSLSAVDCQRLLTFVSRRFFPLKNKNQIDATYYFIVLLIGSTCFGHYYAHHQELTIIMLITILVVSFCKNGRVSVNVKLWFLVMYVQCEVLCSSVVLDNVFLYNIIFVILCVW